MMSEPAPAILEHEESADLLRKSLLPHVRRGRGEPKVLSCKHERLFNPDIIKMPGTRIWLAPWHFCSCYAMCTFT